MTGTEWDFLERLLEDGRSQINEEQLEQWNSLVPAIQAGEMTDVDVTVSLKARDGKRFILSYGKDGRLNISHVPPVVADRFDPGLASAENLAKMSARRKKERLQDIIRETLKDIKFSGKAAGTRFLIEAIMITLSLSNEARRIGVTKEIYPKIARRHGVSAVSVERNIRISIESAWNKMSCDYALEHYPYEYGSNLGRPTNQEFIFAMAGMIRRNYPGYLE